MAANETDDEDKEETKQETTESHACECELTPPVSSDDTTVATCEHSDQLSVCGTSDQVAGNVAVAGEMCLPVKALVKRGKKLTNEDQASRYPSITGTVSERCVQSVEHIVKVFTIRKVRVILFSVVSVCVFVCLSVCQHDNF